jgi:Uri superfamily endonuclease
MDNILNKGVYCLIIRLVRKQCIDIGKLGAFDFPAGFYVYVGSAQNNLKLRIERHLRQKKNLHWHIDYLLRHGKIISVSPYEGAKHMECVLNRKVGGIKNAAIPVMGFGSSDCLCDAHLHFFRKNPETEISGIGLSYKNY